MIRVMKHGRWQYTHKAFCINCGCEFEFNDLMDFKVSSVTNERYVFCPECGAMIVEGTDSITELKGEKQ